MSWNRIESKAKQQRDKAEHRGGKMMNVERSANAGKFEDHGGRLRDGYGIAKEEARFQVDAFKTQRTEAGQQPSTD